MLLKFLYTFISLFITAGYLVFSPTAIQAQANNAFEVTTSPAAVKVGDSRINFNIAVREGQNPNGIFNKDKTYSLWIRQYDSTGKDYTTCFAAVTNYSFLGISYNPPSNSSSTIKVIDNRTMQVSFALNDAAILNCTQKEPGTYWVGLYDDVITWRNPAYNFALMIRPEVAIGSIKPFLTFGYTVYQANGANKPDFEIEYPAPRTSFATKSERPKVRVVNAIKGNSYTFWWGDTTLLGGSWTSKHDYTAQETGNITDVTLSGLTPPDAPTTLKLCMASTTNYWLTAPIRLTCQVEHAVNYTNTSPTAEVPRDRSCELVPKTVQLKDNAAITIRNAKKGEKYRADLYKDGVLLKQTELQEVTDTSVTIQLAQNIEQGEYKIQVWNESNGPACPSDTTFSPGKEGIGGSRPGATFEGKKVCPRACESNDKVHEVCLNGECVPASRAAGDIDVAKNCLNTAIGCVPISLNAFINGLLAWTAGIAGGIAFLLMIMGSLQMITSQGNAEQLKKGREQFIAAISGLLFIIFSITLLQIIGADILGIFPR